MNRNEFLGKLNALYVGDKNCLEELITTYDEKDKEIERLNNRIDKAIEYIEKNKKTILKVQADFFNEDRKGKSKLKVGTFMWNIEGLLEILKGEDKE